MAVTLKNKKDSNIYIIGNEGMYNELVIYFLEHSINSFLNFTLLNSLLLLCDIKDLKCKKKLVLCNCYDMNEYHQLNACARHTSILPADCNWACFNVPHDKKIVANAISSGVRGVFFEDDSLINLKKGISAIMNGELWFARDALSSTLSSLVEKEFIEFSKHSDEVPLTKREKEIFKLLAVGKTNGEVAGKLNISNLTVKTHVSNIYRKINVPNRIQAIFWATKNYVQLKD